MYKQLASRIAASIRDGTYPPNAKLPSETELCHHYDVSRRTVRAAYEILLNDRLVVASHGKGMYVAE